MPHKRCITVLRQRSGEAVKKFETIKKESSKLLKIPPKLSDIIEANVIDKGLARGMLKPIPFFSILPIEVCCIRCFKIFINMNLINWLAEGDELAEQLVHILVTHEMAHGTSLMTKPTTKNIITKEEITNFLKDEEKRIQRIGYLLFKKYMPDLVTHVEENCKHLVRKAERLLGVIEGVTSREMAICNVVTEFVLDALARQYGSTNYKHITSKVPDIAICRECEKLGYAKGGLMCLCGNGRFTEHIDILRHVVSTRHAKIMAEYVRKMTERRTRPLDPIKFSLKGFVYLTLENILSLIQLLAGCIRCRRLFVKRSLRKVTAITMLKEITSNKEIAKAFIRFSKQTLEPRGS